MLEPCPHGEEGEVHGGGGGQEGGARDEHPGTSRQQEEGQTTDVSPELAENSSVEEHLRERADQGEEASEEVEDHHGVGVEESGVEGGREDMQQDVEVGPESEPGIV